VQEENVRLKRLVAELTLDKTMLQDVLAKSCKASRRRPCVSYLQESYQVSERRACRVCGLDRGTCRYQSCLNARTELRLRMDVTVRVRYGYRKIRVLLNREGWNVSRYLAYRLYQEEGLALRPRHSRRRRADLAC
jgi:putative transposase